MLRGTETELPERYRVRHRVATGGMATVYAASDEALHRDVAVKVLGEALASDDSARRRFTREARAAARVSDHPHVVTIFDIGETDAEHPLAFIVMELLTGGTLHERLRSGAPIPHGVALRWLEQAASALDAAHAQGLVHRDVKPANLLIDAHGTLKVADFGIATIASEAPLTQTGQVIGTAAYLSPEQALGRPATPASDRYALGVVAYELLTGRRPYTGKTPAAQALAHAESRPDPPSEIAPGLPPAVDAVLARALAKEPRDRPASAGELVRDLHNALGATAETAIAAAVQRDGPRRSRVAAFAAAGALLLAVLAGIVVLAGGGKSAPERTARAASGAAHRVRDHTAARPKTAPVQTTAATPTAAPPPTPGVPPDAANIEAQAHSRINGGDYAGAIGPLAGLVPHCPVATTNPCAWAWFDLGYALLKAGHPDQAVPVLEQRLRNPDQQNVVQSTLDQARAAAAGDGPGPGKQGHDHHGHGFGHHSD